MNGLWILAYKRLFQDFDYDTYWFWYRIGIKLLKAWLYFFIPDLGMYSLTCLAVLPVAFGRRDCCCLSGSKGLTEHWRETVSSKLIRKLKYFMNSTYLSQETRKLIHVEWFHTLHYVCVVRYFQSACHYHHRCLLRFGPSSLLLFLDGLTLANTLTIPEESETCITSHHNCISRNKER